uniref:Putative secreted protein n=1 Tax=Ixodes ricinus TaxID=34613 RepID=A0A6B0U5S6_IXORI
MSLHCGCLLLLSTSSMLICLTGGSVGTEEEPAFWVLCLPLFEEGLAAIQIRRAEPVLPKCCLHVVANDLVLWEEGTAGLVRHLLSTK